jgi:uncharacterized membrane protein YraQ (UPF0718 family)/GTPase SAR1 family protein
MKTQVDIITGFLGSGKTTFINGLLENEKLTNDRIVIIQCESGEIEIENQLIERKNIYVKKVAKDCNVDAKCINEVIKKYLPHRILIEYNGMKKLDDLLNVLYDRTIRKNCAINKIVHAVDAATFDIFMDNMGPILIEQISGSDIIVLNNTSGSSKSMLDKIEKTLKEINKSAEIGRAFIREEENNADKNILLINKTKKQYKPSDLLFLVFFALITGYLLFSVLRSVDFSALNIDLSWLQALNTVFLSILIQAFPFILFGVLVSSIIQVFVSNETIIKFFPHKKGLGFIVALLAGFLFPVCDCAIVPVAARLVKKGVPLPTAVTFMLAAPIVNPLVIASTLYAFPGQPLIAFYRIYLGMTVAFAVGLAFLFFPEEKPVTMDRLDYITCRCGYCGGNSIPKGFWGKTDAVFRHAGAEFFEVGRFLIIGAFLSSIVQTLIPKDILANIGGGYVISLVIMMLAAFILSICSTSDAFIARTFVNQFPMGAIMGFMVLGPMVDIKNLLMLLGNFKKRFVIKLVFIIFGLSFTLLLVLTRLLF